MTSDEYESLEELYFILRDKDWAWRFYDPTDIISVFVKLQNINLLGNYGGIILKWLLYENGVSLYDHLTSFGYKEDQIYEYYHEFILDMAAESL